MTAAIFFRALRGRWPLIAIPLAIAILGRLSHVGSQFEWFNSDRQAVSGGFALLVTMPVLVLMIGIELTREPWGSWSFMLGRPVSRRRLFATLIAADLLVVVAAAAVTVLVLSPLPRHWGPFYFSDPTGRAVWFAVTWATSYFLGAAAGAGASSAIRAAARAVLIAPLLAVVGLLGAWVGLVTSRVWLHFPHGLDRRWQPRGGVDVDGLLTDPVEAIIVASAFVGTVTATALALRRVPVVNRSWRRWIRVPVVVSSCSAAFVLVGTLAQTPAGYYRGPYGIEIAVLDRAGYPVAEETGTVTGPQGAVYFIRSDALYELPRGSWTVCASAWTDARPYRSATERCTVVSLGPDQPIATVRLVLDWPPRPAP